MRSSQANPLAGPGLHLAGLAALAALGAPAQASGSHGADAGQQAQARIQISLSVRPAMQVRQLPPTSGAEPPSLCVWSNFEGGRYAVKASWNDGRAAQFPIKMQAERACGALGANVRQAPTRTTDATGSRVLTLLITPE